MSDDRCKRSMEYAKPLSEGGVDHPQDRRTTDCGIGRTWASMGLGDKPVISQGDADLSYALRTRKVKWSYLSWVECMMCRAHILLDNRSCYRRPDLVRKLEGAM